VANTSASRVYIVDKLELFHCVFTPEIWSPLLTIFEKSIHLTSYVSVIATYTRRFSLTFALNE